MAKRLPDQRQAQRPPQRQTQIRAARAGEHFVPMLIGGVLLGNVLAMSLGTKPEIGDRITFSGPAPINSIGPDTVKAETVTNIWGAGAQACTLNLTAMNRDGGDTEVQSVNKARIVLQWHGTTDAAPLGCAGGTRLIALTPSDYDYLQNWNAGREHPFMRK